MQDLLCRLEEQKWDWTSFAIKEFNEGFVRHDPSQFGKDRVLIGVYGPTQVGKTTFILKLLGINEEYFSSLSQALRGKRKMGKSATITCTIYEESADEDFVITLPNNKQKKVRTFEQLETLMADVRREIEKSGQFSLEPLKIALSQKLFNREEIDKRTKEISIVDLPGDDSKDKVEMVHVDRVLKEYLPRCKVTILMEIAGQMTNLSQLNREFVRDWAVLPNYFRIVLTRSVTSSSVKTKVENGELKTTNDYMNLYESELARYHEQQKIRTKMYPLEFGQSWAELQHINSSLYQKATIWVDDVFERLVEDLTSVYSPENEIMQLKDIDGYILKRSKDEEDQLIKQKKIIEDDLELSEQELHINSNHLYQLGEKLLNLKEEKTSVKKLKIHIEHNIRIAPWEGRTLSTRTTSALDGEFYYIQDQLKEKFHEQVQKFTREMKTIGKFYKFKLKDLNFEFTETHLSLTNEYIFETYLSKKNFNRDCRRVESLLNSSFAENHEKLIRVCSRYLKDIEKKFEQSIRFIEIEKEGLELEKNKRLLQYLELKERLVKLDVEIVRAHEEWELDLMRSQKLTYYLQKAFLAQFNFYKQRMLVHEVSVDEKWLYHQYLNIMQKQAEGIM